MTGKPETCPFFDDALGCRREHECMCVPSHSYVKSPAETGMQYIAPTLTCVQSRQPCERQSAMFLPCTVTELICEYGFVVAEGNWAWLVILDQPGRAQAGHCARDG